MVSQLTARSRRQRPQTSGNASNKRVEGISSVRSHKHNYRITAWHTIHDSVVGFFASTSNPRRKALIIPERPLCPGRGLEHSVDEDGRPAGVGFPRRIHLCALGPRCERCGFRLYEESMSV